MIYILCCSIFNKETGEVKSKIFVNAWTDSYRAIKTFYEYELNETICEKQLWIKEPGGKPVIFMEDSYHG